MIKEIEMRRSIRNYSNKLVEDFKARPRKKIEDIVHYECWE